MEETKEVRKTTARVYGVPIAWIAVYGALCGVAALIPLFPYVGGGGYLPLCVALEAIAPLVMGPAGIIAAIIGGLIGMFIAPAAYPLGLLDVILTGVLPAVFTTLTVNNHKLWPVTLVAFIGMGIWLNVFPYYIPGPAAGFPNPPQPIFSIMAAYYWVPWTIIMISPLGIRYVPKWIREKGTKRWAGMFIAILSGMMLWIIPWWLPYWYLFAYPVELALTAFVAYSWWVPTLSVITTIIAIPVVEGLSRSGLPKAPGAAW